MGRNVEIKARLSCRDATLRRARALAGDQGVVLRQRDVFFGCSHGRLKLRQIDGERSELIAYRRPDQSGPKTSRYEITEVPDPARLEATLTLALGTLGVVQKMRTLLLVGQTRIHIDAVEGLGDFLELEVVLEDRQTASDGERIAEQLMTALGVDRAELVEVAYIDLLERPPAAP